MTMEERQMRAWIRTVFRHAAIRWLREQAHQRPAQGVPWRGEEDQLWTENSRLGYRSQEGLDAHIVIWMADCMTRLTPRDQQILHALQHGWTQREIAKALPCDISTVRRAIRRIRIQCPRSFR